MEEPFQHFEWHVSRAYHWQAWLDEHGRPVVVPNEGLISLESPSGVELAWQQYDEQQEHPGPVLGPVLDSGKARQYRPMAREHAALFRTFADLDFRDMDAILAFASQYGLLLGADQHQQQGPLSYKLGHHYAGGESQLTWAQEICWMREALHLARRKTSTDEPRDREARGHGLEPLDAAGRLRLTRLFDVHLQHVQGHMLIEPDLPSRLSLAPQTLLSAMWLQFALAVAGDKQFRQCKFCRCLFEISTEQTGFRRHREFCANASCKTQDYRRRKRTALELAKKGVPSRTIAQRIDTKEATVRRWLASSGPRGTGKRGTGKQ